MSHAVSHDNHVQESRESVVFRILDKVVATELILPTVQSKVLPYVQRHKLKLDTVLLQYVKVGVVSVCMCVCACVCMCVHVCVCVCTCVWYV